MAKKETAVVESDIALNEIPSGTAKIIKTENPASKPLALMPYQELLAFREFTDILYAFYDNEMKVYGGEFGVNDSEKYKEASKKASKYLKIKELVFNEIKRRVDLVYEKTLD